MAALHRPRLSVGILSFAVMAIAAYAVTARPASQVRMQAGLLPPIAEICETKVVDGILQQCCKIPYSPYYQCRHYSGDFKYLCEQAGLTGCDVVTIECGADRSHQIGTVIIGGKVCLVAPQTGQIISCDTDTPDKYQAAICQAMGKPFPCDCKVIDYKGPNGTIFDYSSCGMTYMPGDRAKCDACCDAYPCKASDPLCQQWKDQCHGICQQMDGDYPLCSSCLTGYVDDTCDPKTCIQKYNTGRCLGSNFPAPCQEIGRTCQNSGVVCDKPAQIDPPTIGYCCSKSSPDTCVAAKTMGDCGSDLVIASDCRNLPCGPQTCTLCTNPGSQNPNCEPAGCIKDTCTALCQAAASASNGGKD